MSEQHWAVSVDRNGETILTIASSHLSGRDLSAEDEQTIRDCAQHLLAFVGAPAGAPAPAASPDAADRPPAAHTAPARPATGSGPTTRKGPPQGLCEAVLIAEQHMRVTRLSVDEARSVFHEIVRLLTSALKEI